MPFLSGSGLTGLGHPQGSNIALLVLRVGATHGSVGAPVLSTPGEYPTGRLEKLLGKAVLGPFRTISLSGNGNQTVRALFLERRVAENFCS